MISAFLGFSGCRKTPNPPSWTKGRILAKLNNTRGIAAHGGFVFAGNFDYTAKQGVIVRVPAGGGEVKTEVPAAGLVEQLLVHDGYLYWSGDGSLRRIKLTGGEPELVARGAVPALDFSIAAGRIWFSAGIPLSGQHYVYSAPLAGGSVTKHYDGPKAASNPVAVGDALYWMSPAGLVMTPASGGTPSVVYPAQGNRVTSGLARDTEALYFFQQGTPRSRHEIIRYPIGGGQPSPIAAPTAQTSLEILTDGGYLYYFATPDSFGPYHLMRVPRSGGESVSLDSGYSGGQLASSESHIFLLTVNEVVAVPKP